MSAPCIVHAACNTVTSDGMGIRLKLDPTPEALLRLRFLDAIWSKKCKAAR